MTSLSTYEIVKLKDFVFFQEGPGIRNSQNTSEGVKFLNIRCIVDGRLDTASMKKVSENEAYGKYKHFLLDVGDYVVSSSGTLGRIAEVYPGDIPVMLNTSTIRFRPIKNELLDRLYLRYFLESEVFQQQVKSFATGSVQLNYGPSHLAYVEMPLPPIKAQRVIGQVLENLTKQINLNNELSHTLEDIAQTIFKSWFIDFDAVNEKTKGEKPVYMDSETAELFPDSFEESELGLIPRGWKIQKLGDVVDLSWGDTKTTKASYVKEGYPAYSAKGQDGFLLKYDYSELGIILSAIGAGCGKTWIANGKWTSIKNTIRIISNSKFEHSIPYIYLRTNYVDFWPKRGSAQPFISQEDARSLKILVPPKEIISKFAYVSTPLFELINSLVVQNRILTKTRDTIMPELISGNLQIPKEMLAT